MLGRVLPLPRPRGCRFCWSVEIYERSDWRFCVRAVLVIEIHDTDEDIFYLPREEVPI